METHQARALRSLRDYAYARSPFYQRFHNGLTDAPLYELPVLTKALLMEYFDDLVADRAMRLEEVKTHMRNLSSDKHFLARCTVFVVSRLNISYGLLMKKSANRSMKGNVHDTRTISY